MRKLRELRPSLGGAADGTVVNRTVAASEMCLEPLELDGPRRRRPSGARIRAIRGGGDVSARPWRLFAVLPQERRKRLGAPSMPETGLLKGL